MLFLTNFPFFVCACVCVWFAFAIFRTVFYFLLQKQHIFAAQTNITKKKAEKKANNMDETPKKGEWILEIVTQKLGMRDKKKESNVNDNNTNDNSNSVENKEKNNETMQLITFENGKFILSPEAIHNKKEETIGMSLFDSDSGGDGSSSDWDA